MTLTIGKYTVVNPYLGGGGQSHVVEAEADGRRYALKLMTASADDVEALARFDLEAEFLRTIDHPNIVRYVDHGIEGQVRYIAMPKLPGRNLRFELSDRRRLEPLRAADIARQVVTALQVFHQLGAVYRDVKPENIQLDDRSEHVWLLDAGYARYVKKTRITRPGGDPAGTEGYRAPETLQGYDYKQSDFYALGVVLYEVIAGRHPFERRDSERRHRVVPLRQLLPECPRFLAYAVEFLLAWEVRNRPQTAAEVLGLLEDPGHGLRVVNQSRLCWASGTTLPLLVRLSDDNVSSASRAAEADVYPDAYLATTQAASEARVVASDAGRDFIIDLELHQAAYTGFESTPGFASTICVNHANQPLTLDDLHDPRVVRAIARLSLDTEAELGASLKVVPGFAMTDAFPSGWLGCNSALLDECIEALPVDKPFAVRVVLSLEAAPTASARQRVADALGRHHPDLFLLSFAGLNPNASSEQLVRALELAQPFQQIGRCVVCEAGAFAPFWFAFDLGVAVDLVAESPFGTRPHAWATTRFDFPSLLTSLRIEDAKVMLEMSDVPERECPCYACRSSASFAERLSAAVDHNAAMASRERAIAMSMSAAVRQQALSERLGSARASEIAARVGQWEARIARLDAVARALDLADSRLGTLAA